MKILLCLLVCFSVERTSDTCLTTAPGLQGNSTASTFLDFQRKDADSSSNMAAGDGAAGASKSDGKTKL